MSGVITLINPQPIARRAKAVPLEFFRLQIRTIVTDAMKNAVGSRDEHKPLRAK
jgi:hypothetical protein